MFDLMEKLQSWFRAHPKKPVMLIVFNDLLTQFFLLFEWKLVVMILCFKRMEGNGDVW